MKTLLFSIKPSDLKWDFFRAGGKGGQKQNKTDSGARVTHAPSGVACEAREERSQTQNRRTALAKLAAHPKFILWCKMQIAANREGFESVAKKVEAAMADHNLLVEVTDVCTPGEVHVQ